MFPFDFDGIAEAVIAPFGESVIYHPRAGEDRTITVNVDRTDRALLEGTDRAYSPSCVIDARDHATEGITAAEINGGGDAVTVAIRIGQTAKRCKIKKVLESDPGWVSFEVQ